jgi:hypothetical protein
MSLRVFPNNKKMLVYFLFLKKSYLKQQMCVGHMPFLLAAQEEEIEVTVSGWPEAK